MVDRASNGELSVFPTLQGAQEEAIRIYFDHRVISGVHSAQDGDIHPVSVTNFVGDMKQLFKENFIEDIVFITEAYFYNI